ncbi:hypothetical protein FSP39_018106 [Pinctada imbricata]|uniref:Nudix hydrolase domain-containing protein n=1 Tax=Pinctada imbricata TaxID=66713 RepID=A0AA88XFV8_PINIB|nr:hypothetical protein FSP39_018106 [Pinctada imbricata]
MREGRELEGEAGKGRREGGAFRYWYCTPNSVFSNIQSYFPFVQETQYMGNKATAVAKTVATAQSNGIAMSKVHVKARHSPYPRTEDVKRSTVPDDKVPWSVPFPDYKPVDYTSPGILKGPVYADADIGQLKQKGITLSFNTLDGKINRCSHSGEYTVCDGIPRNPQGRTGLKGRGCLGRWGPNHAADPIVTRWKRNEQNEVIKGSDGKPILEFVSVQRKDNGQWAIPGGMVDAGEVITATLRREFSEEAMNCLEKSQQEKDQIEEKVKKLFDNGVEVYRGYVDDPRNTDNAWMETVALNFHDPDGTSVGQVELEAGDDAQGVKWTELSGNLELYASHIDFLKTVAERHNASW